MKKHKKITFITLAAVLMLVFSIGVVGIAMADDEGAQTVKESLYERIAQVYEANTGNAIDAAALEVAFTQARQEITTECQGRMQQRLIEEGRLTQEQLDEMKAWLEAKPDMQTDEFKQWLESKPEGLPFGHGERGHAEKRGFNRMGGAFFNRCAPENAE